MGAIDAGAIGEDGQDSGDAQADEARRVRTHASVWDAIADTPEQTANLQAYKRGPNTHAADRSAQGQGAKLKRSVTLRRCS